MQVFMGKKWSTNEEIITEQTTLDNVTNMGSSLSRLFTEQSLLLPEDNISSLPYGPKPRNDNLYYFS